MWRDTAGPAKHTVSADNCGRLLFTIEGFMSGLFSFSLVFFFMANGFSVATRVASRWFSQKTLAL
jgi:hypothetical protein